jgi:hypothetical protein
MALSSSDRIAPLGAPIIVVDDFLPAELASAMRRDIDAHFAEPNAHQPETQQVWNYSFISRRDAHLRTLPERVIGRPLVDAFHQRLRSWSVTTLGMAGVTWPDLSLYIAGCREEPHNDALTGRFGFVYSLTRNERRTIGGETVVWRESDPFRTNLARPSSGATFYESIEPIFNRLVVFDDRLPHSVERVDGAMDPLESCLVLQGHLSEAGAIVEGARTGDIVTAPARDLLRRLRVELAAEAALYHGPLALRLTIDATGTVARCEVIADRVMHPDAGHAEWEPLRAKLVEAFRSLKFPPAEGSSVLIQPVVFGSSLPRR